MKQQTRANNHNAGDHTTGALRYLAGLDGLRALAVLAVLLYHALPELLPGGFLGVDVFFVISGFLITSLLVREWRQVGKIALKEFWLRRARRLLPACYIVIAAVLVYAVIFLPAEVADLRGDAIAALSYVANWHFIWDERSYFEPRARPSMLGHLWSLGVEEQFYFVWPLLMAWLLPRAKERGVFVVALLLSVASLWQMARLYVPDVDPSAVYFRTDTRAVELLMGAMMALLGKSDVAPSKSAPWRLEIAAIGALAVLAWAFYRVDESDEWLFRGGFALLALPVLVIIAATAQPNCRIGNKILGCGVLTWIGKRSYSLYLWHFPIFLVTRPDLDIALDGWPLLALRMALTFALAAACYRWIETPFRSGKIAELWRNRGQLPRARRAWNGGLTLGASCLLLLATAVVSAKPAPQSDYMTELETQSHADAQDAKTNEPDIVLAQNSVPDSNGGTDKTSNSEVAVARAMEPANLNRWPADKELLWQGRVTALDAQRRTLSLAVRYFALPGGRGQVFQTPRNKAFLLPDKATIQRQLMRDGKFTFEAIELSQIRVGDTLAVIGFNGSNAPISAVSVLLMDEAALAQWQQSVANREFRTQVTPPVAAVVAPVPAKVAVPKSASTPALAAQSSGRVPMFAVGDSVLLGAARTLKKRLPSVEVDGKVSRQIPAGLAILRRKKAAGALPSIVIVHLGTNGPFTTKRFDEMMDILADVKHVIILTARAPDSFIPRNNRVIRDEIGRYPNAVLADWQQVSNAHREYFWKDGTHLRPIGEKAYAELIASYAIPAENEG